MKLIVLSATLTTLISKGTEINAQSVSVGAVPLGQVPRHSGTSEVFQIVTYSK